MKYITRDMPQYKANLHSHSCLSDGTLTPEQMAEEYKKRGYSILAITDHEAPYDHTDLSSENFLMLTGWEAYIRPNAECRTEYFGPEIHMNLLAREPHITTYVAYDPNFCKYMPHELAEALPQAGTGLGARKYSPDYINAFIAAAREAGYLVTYNHPVWSMEEPERILQYDGWFSLEVFNSGCTVISGHEQNLALYERLMRHGKFPFVHGADDNHNKKPLDDFLSDSFRSWTMVLAEDLSYPSVIRALEEGRFYASTGPEIREFTIEGTHVHMEFTPAQRVVLCMSEKKCLNAYRSDGGEITSADFEIPDYAPWFFLTVTDARGREAVTHSFTREQLDLGAPSELL